MPPTVGLLALITLIALVFSIGRLPNAISAGVDLTRSERYLAQHNSRAVPLLESLTKRYPDSTDLEVDLADAYEQARLFDKAVDTLNAMVGKSLSDESYKHASEISDRLRSDSHGVYAPQGSGPDDTGDGEARP